MSNIIKCILLILVILTSLKVEAQSVVLKGVVTNDSKEPIELAQVFVEGQLIGTRCDLKGKYEIHFQSADSVVVVYSMMGYQTRKRILKNPSDTITLNVMLPSLGIELGEVQVKEVRRQTNTMSDISLRDMKHMGNASGMGIESIISTQAGVSTHNELSSQYNVRGGSFDENSVYYIVYGINLNTGNKDFQSDDRSASFCD